MKWLNRTLVTSPFCWQLCPSEKDYWKALKWLKVPKPWDAFLLPKADATVHRFTNSDTGDEVVLVCIEHKPDRPKVVAHALLAHEAVHVWQWIKEHIGEPKPCPEFEAHSIQHLAQRLMEAYDGLDCPSVPDSSTSEHILQQPVAVAAVSAVVETPL